VCVFVALVIQHAMRTSHIFISGLPGSTIFFHIISQTAGFSKKKLLNAKCVLIISQLLSETFLIPRRTERDVIRNVYLSSFEVPVILVRF